jgi:hypothetical protein
MLGVGTFKGEGGVGCYAKILKLLVFVIKRATGHKSTEGGHE